MKASGLLAILLAAGLVAGILLWNGLRKEDPPRVERAPEAEGDDEGLPAGWVRLSPEAVRSAGIESSPATRRSLARVLEAVGRIRVNQETFARVGSPVEGRVSRVRVGVGDRVAAGDPLVDIHSHELIAARADYERARSSLIQAERSLGYAQAELDRATRLLEAKALSVREQLRAQADATAAAAVLEQAAMELRRAEEILQHLGAEPDGPHELVVRSPSAGVVIERFVTAGTVVNPAGELLHLADLSTLWAVAEIPEIQAVHLRPGQEARVRVAAFADEWFPARVAFIGDILDPSTRTLQVRCTLGNPGGRLRPEMYASIRIDLGDTEAVPAVPEAALQNVEGAPVVFVDLGEGTFQLRNVVTGPTSGGFVPVLEGVEEGERIVTRGSFVLKSELLKAMLIEE